METKEERTSKYLHRQKKEKETFTKEPKKKVPYTRNKKHKGDYNG